ncbi:hypothetical protein GTY65_24570 [Streptomyces sp. SID8379]|uniref:hypothetical protein n=1 Tax=unclassified Streptomyces TaxID=2593676 RepID=UPI00037ED066|nr:MULTISPECIES: hypothetical protein [unclassified Streptomyces]MYW67217.1 hypothetical protein [Streptomyces sp. SID8379]
MRELRGYIEELIGEPIIIGPGQPTSKDTPCGMVIRRGGVNYIFYDPDTSEAHQDHIIAHEYAHLLKGHRITMAAQKPDGDTDDEDAVILGDVDDELMSIILGRSDYNDDIEREAEGIGSFLQAYVISSRPAPQSESADRITRTLMRRGD